MIRCDGCGQEFEPALLHELRRSGTQKAGHFCLPCWAEKRSRRSPVRTIGEGALFFGLCLLIAYELHLEAWLYTALFVVVGLIMGLLVHELGHLIFALLLGFKAFRLVLGTGPVLVWTDILGCRVELRRYPFAGFLMAELDKDRGYRLRQFVVTAAGPLANVSLAILCFALLFGEHRSGWVRLFLGVGFSNLFIAYIGLHPRKASSLAGRVSTDGERLKTIPNLSEDRVRTELASRFSLEAAACRERGDLDGAYRWVQEGLRRFPGNPVNETDYGLLLLDRGRHSDALDHFLSILSNKDLDPDLIPMIQNNAAWCGLLMAGESISEETRLLAAEAYKAAPMNPAIMSTQGLALVKSGMAKNPELICEGIDLLTKALSLEYIPKYRANIAFSLAMGEAARGYTARARRFYEMALAADPVSPLMGQAAVAIEAAAPQATEPSL